MWKKLNAPALRKLVTRPGHRPQLLDTSITARR
jgi:hypothetical protein